MKLHFPFSLRRSSKLVKILFLTIVSLLFGCQPVGTVPTSTTPLIESQILEPVTETPVPACVFLSDVELSVNIVSENSVDITITGLIPNEAVQTIFSSQINGQERERTFSGMADENGVFKDSVGLRNQQVDSEFKNWQIRVVHSRGSTCKEISLPEN
jgi:hypothetical protein